MAASKREDEWSQVSFEHLLGGFGPGRVSANCRFGRIGPPQDYQASNAWSKRKVHGPQYPQSSGWHILIRVALATGESSRQPVLVDLDCRLAPRRSLLDMSNGTEWTIVDNK